MLFQTILKSLSFIAALLCVLRVPVAAQQTVQAEIQNLQATPDTSDDPDVGIYKLRFDVRLTNRSEKPISVPRQMTDDQTTTRIFVLGVQSRRKDGPWTNLVQSSWYGVGTEKYDPCVTIPPSDTAAFGGAASGLVLLKKQLASLGNEPTLRFHLMFFCQQPDGKVLTTVVPTEAFSLPLPVQPR
jgi:hypothetical protein